MDPSKITPKSALHMLIAILRFSIHFTLCTLHSPLKERHLRKIYMATSAVRPRADVAYCIRALSRRLTKTRDWTVKNFAVILQFNGIPFIKHIISSLINQSIHLSYALPPLFLYGFRFWSDQ